MRKDRRPTFTFTGTLNGSPKEVTVSPSAWAKARAGGSLAGARLTLRISPPTMLFIEKSVKVSLHRDLIPNPLPVDHNILDCDCFPHCEASA